MRDWQLKLAIGILALIGICLLAWYIWDQYTDSLEPVYHFASAPKVGCDSGATTKLD